MLAAGLQELELGTDHRSSRQESRGRVLLTVGLEDYYQVGAFAGMVPRGRWDRFERRIELGTHRTLDLLDQHNAKATFFVVGWIADQLPELVREVALRGHEIANQGYSHRTIAQLESPSAFRDDLIRSREALERATGRPILGHRVPHFLTPRTLWALDVLSEEGILYDSSVRPLLGQFASRRFIHTHHHAGEELIEVPISAIRYGSAALPLAAGNGLRQLPPQLVQRVVDNWFDATGQPLVTYFHTWELDPEQPRLNVGSRFTRLRHYRNLDQMSERLTPLLSGYECVAIADHLGLDRRPALEVVPKPDPVEVAVAPKVRANRTPITVVIPCYNEADTLPYLENTLTVLERELGVNYEPTFLFVDDGSTDNTAALLRAAFEGHDHRRVIEHEHNKGVAAAMMTGIRASETEIVASMDCDCSYDPVELARMIPRLGENVAMVTASPYHPDGKVAHVPGWRLLLSRGASAMYRQVLDADLYTFTSCFRVYRKSRVAHLELGQSGFLGVAEMLGRLVMSGETVIEHPATLESRLFGHSKMKTLRTIRGHLKLLARFGATRAGMDLNMTHETPAATPARPTNAVTERT